MSILHTEDRSPTAPLPRAVTSQATGLGAVRKQPFDPPLLILRAFLAGVPAPYVLRMVNWATDGRPDPAPLAGRPGLESVGPDPSNVRRTSIT